MSDKDKGYASVKLILLGESNVGKTSIITRYVEDKFNETEATVGAQFFNKKLILPNNKKYLLNIWDTAGAEKFRSVNKFFYRSASIVFLVYDVTNKKSFEEIANYWYEEVMKEIGENVIIFLVGNKCDLFDKETVDESTVQTFAKEKDILFGVCSALDGNGIDKIFTESVEKYDETMKNRKSVKKGVTLENDLDYNPSKSTCC